MYMRTCTEEDRENNKKEQKQSNKTLMSTRFSVLLFRYEVLFFLHLLHMHLCPRIIKMK
jgi:hypothetical protein